MTEALRAVAAVDCGTNSTRLLVASGSGDTIERRMQITRLGAGVDKERRLAGEAIERTLETLRGFRELMDRAGVEKSLATATSAVRDASNTDDFLLPAAEILGAPPRVLPGELEGRLSYRGATSDLDPAGGPYVVVDVGGGSTEIVAPAGDGDVLAVSLDIGCVRVTERFFMSDPPTRAELERARDYARPLVAEAAARHPELESAKRAVGLAGTVSALAVLGLRLASYDRQAVHHSVLTRERIGELIDELSALPLARRRELPGMEVERADVLVGGAVVLGAVMDELGCPQLLVSESDILDGIVSELIEPSGLL